MIQTCEWCGERVGYSRRFVPVMNIPMADGTWRKLYFHPACRERFKEFNPKLMQRKNEMENQK